MQKTTEWKRVDLSREKLDFSNASYAHIENESGGFISLTFILKSGLTVRIRKSNYDVCVESPIIPTEKIYTAKIGMLTTSFKTREDAEKAIQDYSDGEIIEDEKPIKEQEFCNNEVPF